LEVILKWSDVKQDTNKDIQKPYDGSIRYRCKFLILPKKIGHVTRWLEYATWSEEYRWFRKEWLPEMKIWTNIRVFKWEPIQWED
jgi:hypothetical protein